MNRALLGLALLAALAAVLFFRPHATPGPPMRDFEAYYAAGAAANAGTDPYSADVWRFERPIAGSHSPAYAMLPFVSPPAALWMFRALALLPVGAATVLWRVLLLLCILALTLTVLALCGHPMVARTVACGACIATGFGPLTSALALGQLALPAFAAAAGGLIFPAAAVFAWLQPNIALTLFSRLGRRALTWTLVGALIAFAPISVSYVQVLAQHGLAERFSAIQFTPEAIAYGFGASDAAAAAAGIIISLLAFAAWITCMRLLETPLQRFAASCALLPLGMPFFHEHDLIVTLIPAAYFMLRGRRSFWSVPALAAVLCAVDWLGLAQRPDGALQTVLLAFAFVAAGAALRGDLRLRDVLGGAAAPALLLVGAALAAQHHPLPVWPDAMGALPAQRFADAAQAWHAEQAATGLFARDAVWSALRLAPLAGCAILAACALLRLDVDAHHVIERSDAAGPEPA